MGQIVLMIQRGGYLIRELNEKFYFYVDIQTVISWAVIALMYLLYRVLTKYLNNDKQLDSLELIKLLGIYMVILGIVMASYIDVGEIMARANPEYSFFIITAGAIVLVVLMAWASRNTVEKKWWILGALYIPIILLMLTNGRILEERSDSLKGLLPRSEFSFLNLPGEVESLRLGGRVSPQQVNKLVDIVNSHKAVRESAVVGHMDADNMVKPYAYVVLEKGTSPSDSLGNDIKAYVAKRIEENWISPSLYPSHVEFLENDQFAKIKEQSQGMDKVKEFILENKAVADCKIVQLPDKTTSYILLKEGFTPSADLAKEIIMEVYNKIKENNRISTYLAPKWVQFVDPDKIPKSSSGEIKWNILQKKAQNWSDVFPNFPKDDDFIESLSGT